MASKAPAPQILKLLQTRRIAPKLFTKQSAATRGIPVSANFERITPRIVAEPIVAADV